MKLLTRLRELRMQNNAYFAGICDEENDYQRHQVLDEEMGVGAATAYDMIRLNIEEETVKTNLHHKK